MTGFEGRYTESYKHAQYFVKVMADASPTSDGACQKNKKRKYSNAKRASDKARSKTRVNLGLAFVRWRQMRFAFGLKSDAELATFLLDRYSNVIPHLSG